MLNSETALKSYHGISQNTRLEKNCKMLVLSLEYRCIESKSCIKIEILSGRTKADLKFMSHKLINNYDGDNSFESATLAIVADWTPNGQSAYQRGLVLVESKTKPNPSPKPTPRDFDPWRYANANQIVA